MIDYGLALSHTELTKGEAGELLLDGAAWPGHTPRLLGAGLPATFLFDRAVLLVRGSHHRLERTRYVGELQLFHHNSRYSGPATAALHEVR